MKRYSITFETDAANSGAKWSNRSGSEVRMMQSITDYLENRCRCSAVVIKEVAEEPPVAPKPHKVKAPVAPKLGRKQRKERY